MEGSVQRSGNRTRITAQLIDVLTGNHLWAERYDHDLKDQFAVQDEVAIKILMATLLKLRGQQGLSLAGSTKYFTGKQGVDCYLKILEGHRYYYGFNIEDNRMARRIAEEAIATYPEVPMSYVLMGCVHQLEYLLSLGKSPQESIERGVEMVQKALAMDDSIVAAHCLLSQFYTFKRDYEKALAEGERAVALEPNGEAANTSYATNLNYVGRPKEAIPILEKALGQDPLGRGTTLLYLHFGIAFQAIGQFEEAVTAYRKAIYLAPNNIFAHLGLAATYPVMGREEKAGTEAAEVLRINPRFSVDEFAKVIPGKDRSRVDEYINALRKAGLK
jgi:adenylate cyclase